METEDTCLAATVVDNCPENAADAEAPRIETAVEFWSGMGVETEVEVECSKKKHKQKQEAADEC